MRKKYLVQAVFCSLLGANAALAEDQTPAAPAAPLSPEEAAGLHDKLRTMSPEERREYLDEQHAKMREQAEASMPPPPPGAEEMKERHEKLKEMTPEERRAYLQQESEKRRSEAEAAIPVPPVQAGTSGQGPPSAEEAKERREKLKAMAPEERREYLRAESEQKRKEAEAAMPIPPPPPPVLGGAPEPTAPSAEEIKAQHEKLRGMTPEERRAELKKQSEERRAGAAAPVPPMPPAPVFGGERPTPPGAATSEKLRSMTPEQRRAYRNQRYQELRRQAAAEGLDLPETPPWAQQPPPGIRYMTDDERTKHWETMSEMTPEERAVYRAEHHQRMMERAQETGQAVPQIPEWVKQQQEQMDALKQRFEALSPEDKEACFAMQRLMRGPGMGRRWGGPVGPAPDYPVGPGVGRGARPDYSPAGTPEFPPPGGSGDYTPEPYVPGYGYGPGYGWGRGYGPAPGYGQDYPPAPGYGYGPQSGPAPGY